MSSEPFLLLLSQRRCGSQLVGWGEVEGVGLPPPHAPAVGALLQVGGLWVGEGCSEDRAAWP